MIAPPDPDDEWRASTALFEELGRWSEFRRHQELNRENPDEFRQYEQFLNEHRQRYGMAGTVELHQQLEKQTKLDHWKEYQVFLHRKRAALDRRFKLAQLALRSRREELAAGYSRFVQRSPENSSVELQLFQDRASASETALEDWKELWRWAQEQLQLLLLEDTPMAQKMEHRGEGNDQAKGDNDRFLNPIPEPFPNETESYEAPSFIYPWDHPQSLATETGPHEADPIIRAWNAAILGRNTFHRDSGRARDPTMGRTGAETGKSQNHGEL
ncbi:MAG: hypothetical protein M1817_001773 [Caeruleum heppii]|nr:MAG: hypothetical protein M1817_001773 [Caeruleum heppii]